MKAHFSLAPRWSVALVTGASSGIGRAFAEALASDGCDLVLVARRQDLLDALAADLRSMGRTVEVLAADLTDPEGLALVEDRLRADTPERRPVDLLVNNAGFGSRGSFTELPIDVEEQEIRLNVLAPVRLTRAVLDGMIRRRHGGVVNVSSIAGLQPLPYWATYGATKSYLNSFSLALHEEVRDQGVHVLLLMPGFTHTEFHDRLSRSEGPLGPSASMEKSAVPALLWLSADRVVEATLQALDRGRATCVPGLGYRAFALLTRYAPWSIARKVARSAARRG